MARTRNSMRLLSTGSARSTDATSSTTVDPAGITAPLLPMVGLVTVAVNLSPARAVLVQTRPLMVMPMREPAPMTPAAGAGAGAGSGVGDSARGAGVRGACATW